MLNAPNKWRQTPSTWIHTRASARTHTHTFLKNQSIKFHLMHPKTISPPINSFTCNCDWRFPLHSIGIGSNCCHTHTHARTPLVRAIRKRWFYSVPFMPKNIIHIECMVRLLPLLGIEHSAMHQTCTFLFHFGNIWCAVRVRVHQESDKFCVVHIFLHWKSLL